MYENFIASRITQLRQAKGVSARDMSLSIGQNEAFINHIENRKTLPSMPTFFYICEYFKITPMEFFDEGNSHPERLTNLIKGLKRLDEKALSHIEGFVEELIDKK